MDIKIISKFLIAFSVVVIIFAMSMDTTVSTGYGRVNNLGLLNDQSNLLILGGIGFIGGIILFSTAKIKQTTEEEIAEKEANDKKIHSVEQRFEKVSTVMDGAQKKTFDFLDSWLSTPRDNILGRVIIFVYACLLAIPIWKPLIIIVGVYLYRPVSSYKLMTHVLWCHLIIDLIFFISFLSLDLLDSLEQYIDIESVKILALMLSGCLAIVSCIGIFYLKNKK
jgi:hypothetical protein